MIQDHITFAIWQRVRHARHQRGWSADALAGRMSMLAGVSFPRSVITNLDNNRRESLSVKEIVGLAHVLNTTVDWLIWGTGAACSTCGDSPPAGFTCNACARSTAVRVADVLDQGTWLDGYITG